MADKSSSSESCRLDQAGVFCSGACALQSILAGACAIHCMLAPIIVFSAPSFGAYFENAWIHVGLLVLITPIAILAFQRGLKTHGKRLPLLLGSIGFLFFLVAAVMSYGLKAGNEEAELLLKLSASALLIAAHVFNMKFLKKAQAPRESALAS